MEEKYKSKFYRDRHKNTFFSAWRILSIITDSIPEINSAVDFGCGAGTWLSVLKEKGIKEILGMDGAWVNKKLLEIPQENFHPVDFEQPIKLDRKYDIAISLEVAEHLRPQYAKTFVKNLVNASDFILFSAAIPFQGGKHHLNEQWPSYWESLFNNNGYIVVDCIRKEVWNEKDVSTWYRQNTLLFIKKERMKDLNLSEAHIYSCRYSQIDLVHPEMFLKKMNQMYTLKGSWKSFRRTLRNWFKNQP